MVYKNRHIVASIMLFKKMYKNVNFCHITNKKKKNSVAKQHKLSVFVIVTKV